MSREGAGLADTSIFVAREDGRALGSLPERLSVSVVTIGELQLGVLAATERDLRAQRAETLALARRIDPLPVGEAVMVSWARLVHDCRSAGIGNRVRQNDALIAATAIEHGLPIVTQDEDFEVIAEAHPALDVIRV